MTVQLSPFLKAVAGRRSVYSITNRSPISDKEIRNLVATTLLNAPSSFNSQSTRIVVLLKKEHEKFWDNAANILKSAIGESAYKGRTEDKMKGFRAGYGSILFFEDPKPVQELQNKFPIYSSNFPVWSEHTSAIHQFILWTALSEKGLGASLQHYSPLVDPMVTREWGVSEEWQLKAQLVFGEPVEPAGEKQSLPIEERLFVHGAEG